jgi:integrase
LNAAGIGSGPNSDRHRSCIEDGRPPHPEHFSDRFDVLVRQAEVPVIRFHDLRHSCATLALAAGIPVKIVSEMLGHSNPAITQSIYQHVLPGMAEDAGAKLTVLLGLSG